MTKVAAFCISSVDYINRASISLNSLKDNVDLPIDLYNVSINDIINKKYDSKLIQSIYKENNNNTNVLRWSLKSCLLLHFLQDLNYNQCIYIDNDIYFVNDATFLFNQINKGILLTKHNRPSYPSNNPWIHSQFTCNFTEGFFNAGFIGASQNGVEALEWWCEMNIWRCSRDKCLGLHDDQKYLDILALKFHNNTTICDHPGCNLATWNSQSIKRSFIKDKWKIQDIYDPIFLHFSSMDSVHPKNDPMLFMYYNEYLQKI